jgi:hypothetical protein
LIVNSRTARVLVVATVAACGVVPAVTLAEAPALRLQATAVAAAGESLTIELLRWSTDQERAPLVAALSAPPPPARGAAAGAAAAGRGGRGGRGAGAPPLTPAARLSAAVKAAPTVGFIWGNGPTGYAIKYAWREASASVLRRVVLVTERRLGAHSPSWPQASAPAADAEFTVLEFRFDAKGNGEAKASLMADTGVDASAPTLTLDGYAQAPVLLKVTQ